MNPNQLNNVLNVARFVASAGVGQVVSNVIAATLPRNANTYQRIMTGIGSMVISAVISDFAADKVVEIIRDFLPKEKIEETPKENIVEPTPGIGFPRDPDFDADYRAYHGEPTESA
jgi:hypothetical protein